MEREIGVEIKSSLNLPSRREMKADIDKLKKQRVLCLGAIDGFNTQIDNQVIEKEKLELLAENPLGDDGVTYNAQACADAAKQCDKHIGMLKAMIKKEQAKVDQLDYMIREIENRICLSEQMSL